VDARDKPGHDEADERIGRARKGPKSLFLPASAPSLSVNQAGRAARDRRDGGNSMGGLSIWHWIVVIAVLLLLFGRGKISELMGDVAQGIKAFKKGMQEEDKTAGESKTPEPGTGKTIEHQPAETVAQTESRKAS